MKLLCICLLILASTANAAVNPRCSSNAVSSVVTARLLNFPHEVDHCQTLGALPPGFGRILDQLGVLHRRLEAYLGVPFEQLVPGGIGIRFSPTFVYESTPSPGRFTIAVQPTWTGELDVEDTEYIHDLAHIITATPGGTLYQRLLPFKGRLTFDETFADALALGMLGKPVLQGTGGGVLPPVLRFWRRITTDQSFRDSFRTFYRFTYALEMLKTCEGLWSAGSMTSEAAYYCHDFELWRIFYQPLAATELDVEFRAEHCLNSVGNLIPYVKCDPHIIGIPVNSFVLDLQQELGADLYRGLFSKILLAAEPRHGKTFSCAFGPTERPVHAFPVRVQSFVRAFELLREELPRSQQANFDEAWKRHELSILVKLESYELKQAAAAAGTAELRVFFQGPGTATLKPGDACWNQLPRAGGGCALSCLETE